MKFDRILVVTGTDTGVGKTFVAAALSRFLSDHGLVVTAVKPVESGCAEPISETEDGVLLASASRQKTPQRALTRLKTPVAPPVAADLERIRLSPESWIGTIRALAREADLLLVEGAGGLLSPLTWSFTLRDLAKILSAECLVVSSDKLGTLNHTLLTCEALEQVGLTILGVVLNAPSAPDNSTGHNEEALVRFAGMRRVFSLPRINRWEEAVPLVEPVAHWIIP